MNFVDAVKSAYRNYVNFSGRSVRSEYWWFYLFYIIAIIVIMIIEVRLGLGQGSYGAVDGGFSVNMSGGPLSIIWLLVNFIPSLAVGVRRLHDTDRSGWRLFIVLIPLVGAILLIVWLAKKGTSGANRFGEEKPV